MLPNGMGFGMGAGMFPNMAWNNNGGFNPMAQFMNNGMFNFPNAMGEFPLVISCPEATLN